MAFYLTCCAHLDMSSIDFNTWGKAKSMTHDSYFCHIVYPGSIGFPTKRKEGIGNFVEAVLDRNDKIPSEKKSEQ